MSVRVRDETPGDGVVDLDLDLDQQKRPPGPPGGLSLS